MDSDEVRDWTPHQLESVQHEEKEQPAKPPSPHLVGRRVVSPGLDNTHVLRHLSGTWSSPSAGAVAPWPSGTESGLLEIPRGCQINLMAGSESAHCCSQGQHVPSPVHKKGARLGQAGKSCAAWQRDVPITITKVVVSLPKYEKDILEL